LDVLDHLIRQHCVEAGVGVGQSLAGGVDEEFQPELARTLGRAFALVFEAMAVGCVGQELVDVQAKAAAVIQDATARSSRMRLRGPKSAGSAARIRARRRSWPARQT